MEHHDIIAECGRFTLDRSREEILGVINSRCTPPLGQHHFLCSMWFTFKYIQCKIVIALCHQFEKTLFYSRNKIQTKRTEC